MNILFFFVLALLPSVAAFSEENLPDDLSSNPPLADIVPVLRCPAVPEAYAKMITQLNVLKTTIKQEAACEPLRVGVSGLETLLGERRTEVQALIERSKTEPLAERDLFLIREYVEDVTKKVLGVAELFNRNNYCFIEDKKSLTFSDLASVTLDATALAQAVAGPWSTPISLGGQALAGIFQGLNTIVTSRRGHDFAVLAQRQSYVQSLCAYYNYRQNIEYLLYPQKRVLQLRRLESTLREHLEGVFHHCGECHELSARALARIQGEEAAKTEENESKEIAAINALTSRVNSLYEQPLGTYTVKALSSLHWISKELQAIAEDNSEEAAIGRDLLSEVKVGIDRFLFEREAPEFVKFQAGKAFDLFYEFQEYVINEGDTLLMQARTIRNAPYQEIYRLSEADILKAVVAEGAWAADSGQENLAFRIADFQRKGLELFERTRLATSVMDTYCTFFKRAGVYNSTLQHACEGSIASDVRKNLLRLAGNDGVPQPTIMAPLAIEYVADWADSLTKVVARLQKNPRLYQKKAQGL